MKRDIDFVDPRDYKYTNVDADPDFDPEHNKRVVEETIRKYELNQIKIRQKYGDKLKERSEALAMFLKARGNGKAETDIKKYFGDKYLDYLKGKN